MDSLPRTVLQRQLGFNCGSKKPALDTKKLLTRLQCADFDVGRVAENEDNLFDQIPIYDLKFCPVHFHPHFLAVTDELGYVSIVSAKVGLEEEDKIILKEQCHQNALFNMDWSPQTDGVLATCAGDQLVKVWDIKKDFGNLVTFKGHERTVKSVKFHPTHADCLISSGRDGTVRCWDVRAGESAVNVIRNAHGNCKDQVSVTDIVFNDENTVITCGAKDGVIKMWDLRKTYTGLKKMVPLLTFGWDNSPFEIKGYHSLCLDNCNNLYATTYHEVLKYNLSTEKSQSDPAHFIAPDAYNCYIKINTSPDGRFLLSGSTVSEVYMWDTWDASPEPFQVLKCSQPVVQMPACVAAFSPHDIMTIVSGNDEGRIHVWRTCFDDKVDPNVVTAAQNLSTENLDLISRHVERYPSNVFEANIREAEVSLLRCFGTNSFTSSSKCQRDKIQVSESVSNREIDMRSLLKDLPNFVMDGTHPSLPDVSKVSKRARKPCWLGGITRKIIIKNNQLVGKRPLPSTLTPQDLNTQEPQPQVKRIKLKLKIQQAQTPKTRSPTTRSPKTVTPNTRSKIKNPSTPISGGRGRRTSVDATTQGKSSPSQNILKYFSVDRPSMASSELI
ncbi:unnamed protein product [Allacma fusca]|uniref:Denticleless protein homolog n=1 Tax=Allacma fusca TaxID=39272 RepID=A0A8J2LR57_9HEXA|nr:unnamed protein product [Allacma fusca]